MVTALRSATLVVLVCVGSLANDVSMVEDFKQRAFEDCRVTLGDTKERERENERTKFIINEGKARQSKSAASR